MITHLTMFALKIYFEFSGMVAVQLSMFLFAVFFNSHINLTYLFMFVNNFFNFFKKSLWSSFKRRRRDLNPRAAINDLLPFQGSPFSHLGTSPRNLPKTGIQILNGKGGIRTHDTLRCTGFRGQLLRPLGHLSRWIMSANAEHAYYYTKNYGKCQAFFRKIFQTGSTSKISLLSLA